MLKLTDLMPSINQLVPCDYAAVKDSAFEHILDKALSSAPAKSQPEFVQVSGVPGAGKSTFCRRYAQSDKVMISFDAIMEQLPKYKKDVERYGSKTAFHNWELPARVAGYELLRRAISRKQSICLEHSGVNDAHIELFHSLKKLGFSTEVDFILCPLDVALSRTQEREKTTNRHTPESLIRERFSAIQSYLPRYQQIADKTIIYHSDNNYLMLAQDATRSRF